MVTINGFDRSNLSQLRLELEKALQTVGNQYGIVFGIGSIRFDEKTFTSKLSAAITSKTASNSSNARVDVRDVMYAEAVKKYGYRYGVAETDIGKRVTIDGQNTWTFVGINTRGRRMPYIYQNMNGRRIKAARNYVNLTWKAY
jgi:hypothetical protein